MTGGPRDDHEVGAPAGRSAATAAGEPVGQHHPSTGHGPEVGAHDRTLGADIHAPGGTR